MTETDSQSNFPNLNSPYDLMHVKIFYNDIVYDGQVHFSSSFTREAHTP
jgi:hypothetical protein